VIWFQLANVRVTTLSSALLLLETVDTVQAGFADRPARLQKQPSRSIEDDPFAQSHQGAITAWTCRERHARRCD
jgi:hypothetical protein